MLNTIGESVVRTTTRMDNNLAVENRDVALDRAQRLVEERPVENAQESASAQSNDQEKSGGYNIDDKGVFFEKYDKRGNVVYRLPPEKKPIDELV